MRSAPGRWAARAAVALAVVVLGACSSFESYAAEVNGRRITQDELRGELKAILGNRRYLDQVDQGFAAGGGERAKGAGKGTFNTVFVAAVLDRRIGFTLIREEVRRRRIRVTPAMLRRTRSNLEQQFTRAVFSDFPASYREDLVRAFAEASALQEAMRAKVDDAAVRRFYEENPGLFAQTCVGHILVASEAKAAEVKTRLDGGEDFAAVARAESTDNQGGEGGSAAQGGDLGCVGSGSFVPEFETAMGALQPGQVSAPVKTQFGFHLIKVRERTTRSLDEAAPQIRENLQSRGPDPVQEYLTKALASARIKVNPRYGRFVKTGPNPGVQAPKVADARRRAGPAPAAPPAGGAPAGDAPGRSGSPPPSR